jgi:hypothetical protein
MTQMLQDLSLTLVEQALVYLDSPVQTYPLPEELQQLNLMEWHLLDQMLQKLLWERANSPVQ